MLTNMILAASAVLAVHPSDAAVETAASDWVVLVDQEKWSESWGAASPLFRSQLTSGQWQAAVEPVRSPLGTLQSRKLEKITAAKSLPGVPDGEYRIVEFRTVFANKADAVETIVLAQEGSKWAVNGYFIR
jgi:hypothetical protein